MGWGGIYFVIKTEIHPEKYMLSDDGKDRIECAKRHAHYPSKGLLECILKLAKTPTENAEGWGAILKETSFTKL